jgi:hypothetical protein
MPMGKLSVPLNVVPLTQALSLGGERVLWNRIYLQALCLSK